MQEHGLKAGDISSVKSRVHGAAIDVLGQVTDPRTIHQSKFSMGFVLAVIAVRGKAGIEQFTEATLEDPARNQRVSRQGRDGSRPRGG